MASDYIKIILDTVDHSVSRYVFNSYAALADKMGTTLRLMFILFFSTYGMSWLMGWIPATLQDFIKNLVRMIFIYTFSTHWEIFSTTLYPVVTNAPDQIGGIMLAAAGSGDSTSINGTLGTMYNQIVYAASQMMFETDISAFGMKLIGFALGAVIFAMIIYAVFLIVLAKVALAVLLGLAPLFIALMTFSVTRGLFEGWLRQLMNFALIPLITYGVLIFVIAIIGSMADDIATAAKAGSLTVTKAYPLILAAGVSVILLNQVMGIASGLAGGMQLSTLSPIAAATKNAFRGIFGGLPNFTPKNKNTITSN